MNAALLLASMTVGQCPCGCQPQQRFTLPTVSEQVIRYQPYYEPQYFAQPMHYVPQTYYQQPQYVQQYAPQYVQQERSLLNLEIGRRRTVCPPGGCPIR